MSRCTRAAGLALAVAMAAASAEAKINPNFTPIQLFQQSGTILKVKLKATDKPLIFDIEVVEAFKGDKGKLKLDLSAASHKEQGEVIGREVKARAGETFLLFAGEFHEEGPEGGGQQMCEGYLHMGQTRWIGLYRIKEGGGYEMGKLEDFMEGTWAGSTDMLEKCLRYIQDKKSDAAVPVVCEASWDRNTKVGKLGGKVSAAIAVDAGDAEWLFVACDAGDRLFVADAKSGELVDVTAKVKLAGKSRVAVWGDFDRNGKPDLASFDGKALTLHLQQADGTFAAKPLDTGDALKDGCVSLSVVDCGKETPGLLAGTKGNPVLLSPAGEGKMSGTVLAGPPAPPGEKDVSAKAGQCLVADFDNDGIADVVQLFNSRGVVFKGKAPGQFDKGQPADICLGEKESKAWLGDYDADGKLDVFCVAEDRCRMWQNMGGFKFSEMLGLSGEISYISKGNGIDGMTCDFNNDGRLDILVAYSNMPPQLFFNRGWRSTGHAHNPIDLAELGVLPESADGQQAGCMGDFNGDGAQDMAIVLTNGELHVFYRKVFDGEPALGIRVGLPGKAGPVGPVTVVCYQDKMCLGAYSVTAGSTSGFYGLRQGGVRTFQWKTPDGKSQEAQVKVLDQAVRALLEPKK